jgi:hypothetical protein
MDAGVIRLPHRRQVGGVVAVANEDVLQDAASRLRKIGRL